MTHIDYAPDGYLVGVDIGGTKTELRIETGAAPLCHRVQSASWRQRDWDRDAEALLGLIAAQLAGRRVAAIGIGAHGCDDAQECRAFQSALSRRTGVPVAVINDAELMPHAAGLPGAIGVVAGTGSIAVWRSGPERMLVAGGWGWVIGDEGSSAGLMREAVRHMATHIDEGGAPADPLVEALFDALNIPSVARIGSSFTARQTAAQAGAHADVIFEAAAAGSRIAARVIAEGGDALACLVARLERRGATATEAVAGGGVMTAQPQLRRAFAEALAIRCDGRIRAVFLSEAPVVGACHLAGLTARAKTGTEPPASLSIPAP